MLASWVIEPTHLKNMLVKLDHFPKFRDENKQYLSCHHLGFFSESLSYIISSYKSSYSVFYYDDHMMILYSSVFSGNSEKKDLQPTFKGLTPARNNDSLIASHTTQ